jgi:ADP-ribose pyrophosphatase YjhB (NUDIX family)
MIPLGVNISIFHNGKILLTKREDFEVWCLPGGAVDEGESVAQAAIREAREETGLEVELTRLIGVYSQPNWPGAGMHIISFAAIPTGGKLEPDPNEVIDIGFFAREHLPSDLLFWQKQRIADAFNGVGGGVVWLQEAEWPFERKISRAEMYAQRDASGLSRSEFYFQTLGLMKNAREVLEVGKNELE